MKELGRGELFFAGVTPKLRMVGSEWIGESAEADVCARVGNFLARSILEIV